MIGWLEDIQEATSPPCHDTAGELGRRGALHDREGETRSAKRPGPHSAQDVRGLRDDKRPLMPHDEFASSVLSLESSAYELSF